MPSNTEVHNTDPHPSGPEIQVCPMCGKTVQRAATRCPDCGEELGSFAVGPIVPTKIFIRDVVNQSWRIFRSQMGLCVGITLLYVILQLAGGAAMTLLRGEFSGENMNPFLAETLVGIGSILWNLFLTLGIYQFMLKLAQGQNATPSDLFSSGSILISGIVSGVLTSILVALGFILLIVPGIYLLLSLSQIFFVIIDRRCGPIEALHRSWEITRGNLRALLGLVLTGMAILFLGYLAVCIGLIFAWPLVMLMQAVAYLRMSGQPIVQVP